MKRILLAYDGTPAADTAMSTTVALAKALKAEVGVVSVVPVHPGRTPVDPWDDKPVHDRQLDDARSLAASHGVVAEILEPAGDPATAIERVAEAGRFDTIVVGSRGLGWMSRILQGSVSTHVATHSSATVIVAR